MKRTFFELQKVKGLMVFAGIFVFLITTASMVSSAEYSIVDLGTVTVSDINNLGQVIGKLGPSGSNGSDFLWEKGVQTGLSFTATDINNKGQVIGYQTAGGQLNIVNWANGVAVPIAVPTFNPNYPAPLNADTLKIVDSGSIYATFEAYEPFVAMLQYGTTTWQAIASQIEESLYSVNNNSQYVGYTTTYGRGFFHDSNNQAVTFGDSFDNWMLPTNINDTGQVVGNSANGAFLWENETTTILGTGNATDINNTGQIVGESAGLATLWENGAMLDLNTLVTDSHWLLQSATSINDLGQIIGWGTFNGVRHSFLLSPDGPAPVPEPSTLLLTGTALACILLRKYSMKDI